MGNFSAWTSPLVLLALLVQGGVATTLTAIPAATSLTTFTSTYPATVTNTITSIVPVTTTQTTCTPGTTAPLDYQCTNSAWSSNGVYWQELCTTASLQGPIFITVYVGTNLGPQYCRTLCNSVYGALCAAGNFNPINRQCTLLRSVTATAAVSSIGYAAIEKFTTNPCIVTSTGSSTQLSIETAVVEQTTTITATITLSTSTASPSPTASACAVSTLATLPSTTECVDGYYQYNGYYYQVLCDHRVTSYGGFDIPSSYQSDIWDCIEGCSQYSNCVGTFWYQGSCISPTSVLEYGYIPESNTIQYIAMRLDGNPCPAASSSVSLIQSSAASSSSAVISSSAHTSASIVSSAAAIVSSSAHTSASIVSSSAAVVSSSAHTSASIASSSSAIVPPSSVPVQVSSSTPLSRSSSTPLIRPTVTISPHSTAPSTAPSSVRASSTPGVAPSHSNSVTVSSPAALSTPASSVPIHSVSVPSGIASSVSNSADSASSASSTATSAISLTSTGVPSAPAPPGSEPSGSAPSGSAPSGTVPSGSAPSGTVPSGSGPSGTAPSGSEPSGSEPSGHESSGSAASTVVSYEHGNQPTGSPGNTATSGSTTDTSALLTATQTAGQATTTAPPQFTTSTVFTTEVHTITACPASVTDCPAREQTTYITTETIAAYTTICPITAEETGAEAKPTGGVGSNGQHESLTTSTVFTTQVHPTTVCPSHIKNCAGSQKTTSLVTETVIAYVTVCPVAEAEATSTASLQAPSHNQDAATTLTIATYITETATLATTYKTVNAGSTVEKTASYISTTVIPVTKTVIVTGTQTIDVSPTGISNESSAYSTTESSVNGGSVGNASVVSGQDNVQPGAQHSPLNISHSVIASSSAFISSTTKSTESASSMTTGSFTEASATTSPAFNGVASKTASWFLSSLFALAVVGYLSW